MLPNCYGDWNLRVTFAGGGGYSSFEDSKAIL